MVERKLTTRPLTRTSTSPSDFSDFLDKLQKSQEARIEGYRENQEFVQWSTSTTGSSLLPQNINSLVGAYDQQQYCLKKCSSVFCPYEGKIWIWQGGAFQKCPCEKWQEFEKQRQAREYERRLQYANIPPLFQEKTLDSYIPQNESQRKALAICKSYKPGIGLYLCGAVGTGKTHLAAGILKEVCKKMPGYFISVSEALHYLRPPHNNDKLFETLVQIPFLVLDDLGVQKSSEWTNEQLTLVLDIRKNQQLATVITSNLPIEVLAEGGIEGERMASRIKEMCAFILIIGGDYRDKINKFNRNLKQ